MSTYPRGPLSLIYHLVHTAAVQAAFHADINKTMADFGLTDNEKKVFRQCGAVAEPNDALIKAVLCLAVQEVRAKYYEAW